MSKRFLLIEVEFPLGVGLTALNMGEEIKTEMNAQWRNTHPESILQECVVHSVKPVTALRLKKILEKMGIPVQLPSFITKSKDL